MDKEIHSSPGQALFGTLPAHRHHRAGTGAGRNGGGVRRNAPGHKLIRMTNAGRTQAAWDFVNQAEWLLQEIHKLDQGIDLTWDDTMSLLNFGGH